MLEPEGSALAVAVQPGFAVSAHPAAGVHISLPDLGTEYSTAGLPDRFDSLPHPALLFPLWSLKLLQESYGGKVTGVKLEFQRQQGGLALSGASSALTVGTVVGAAAAAGLELTPEEVFRVAAAAHARVQSGGSGYDVATCAYGGMVLYRPPAGLSVAPSAGNLHLVAADSGCSSDTAALLKRFHGALTKKAFRRTLDHHRTVSNRLCHALWAGQEQAGVQELVDRAHASLERLDRDGGIGIFTTELKQLLAIAGGAKIPARISGAGGGDLVVGFAFDADGATRVVRAWRSAGFKATSFTPALIAIR